MKRLIPFAIAVVLSVGAYAYPGNGKHGARLAEALDLTDDQKANVEAIFEAHRERRQELRELDRKERREAAQLLRQDLRSDLSAVLTTEQLAKFDAMKAQRKDRKRQRLSDALELTDTQQGQVEDIMSAHRDRMKGLRDLDRSERRAAVQEAQQDLRAQMATVLDDQQLAKFDQIRANKRNKMRHRRHHRKLERDAQNDTL